MVYILAFFTTKSATVDLQLGHSAMHSRVEKITLRWIEAQFEAKKRQRNIGVEVGVTVVGIKTQERSQNGEDESNRS